jgi:mono/diheme cytochrome c family protein
MNVPACVKAEEVSVSVCRQFVLVGLVCALAGCADDASKMRFVENSTIAKPVHRKARAAVVKSLEDHFGTPINSQAWLKLPVKYGRAEGKITSVEDQTLAVELNAEATDLTGFDSAEFAGTELLLTSGANQGKALRLASFDPQTKSFEMVSSEVAPAAGDQFVAGGNVLKHGRKLYARHCQHCHGISGDGDGPTAKYLNPRPRDYRQGKFKFTSTAGPAGKATRDDLRRIVGLGIPGTYMPAFVPMLKDGELTAIVEYVRWLAMRGEVEWQLLGQFKDEYAADRAKKEAKESGSKESEIEKQIATQLNEFVQSGLPALVDEIGGDLAEKWTAAEEKEAMIIPAVPRVADSEESRKRGKELFFTKRGNCVNCHGSAAKGNGPQTEEVAKNLRTGELYPAPGLFDDWDQPIKPRDLTRGIYRGGRRPIDLYRRITQGIKGTPMPGAPKELKPEEIWDLVNYVLSIPFDPQAKPHKVAGHLTDSGHGGE